MVTDLKLKIAKARFSGLRVIAMTKSQMAAAFLEAWPDGADEKIDAPDSYINSEYESGFAGKSFWEDVEQWGEWSPEFLKRDPSNGHVKMFVNGLSEFFEQENERLDGETEWTPIRYGLEQNSWMVNEVFDEWWFPKWLELVKKYEDVYWSHFLNELGQTQEAIQFADMEVDQFGGTRDRDDDPDDILMARRAKLEEENIDIGQQFANSNTFQNNWLRYSSKEEPIELPDGFGILDIIEAATRGVSSDLSDVLERALDNVCTEVENGAGMMTPMDQLKSRDEMVDYLLVAFKDVDLDKYKQYLSDNYSSTIDNLILDEAGYQAKYRMKANISDDLGLEDVHGDSYFKDIGTSIAASLASGKLDAETLIEHYAKGLFGEGHGQLSSDDFRQVRLMLENWQDMFDDGTLYEDEATQLANEQAENQRELWLDQRRNRTPEGNAYDVGDYVLLGSQHAIVQQIERGHANTGEEWWYFVVGPSLFSGRGQWAREDELAPDLAPEQPEMERDASILDEPADTLDPLIFDLDADQTAPKMHSDVREKILKQLQRSEVNSDAIKAVLFFGSAAAYQYEPESDFDIAVVVDPSLTRQGNDALGLNHEISNELFIAGHPVTFYFREDDYPVDGSDAIYDVVGDFWIRVPQRSESALGNPEYADTVEDAKEWAKVLDVQIGELRRDVIDYEKLKAAYQRAGDERKQELYGKVQDVISQLNEDVSLLASENDELHATRLKAFQTSLEEGGEDAVQEYVSRNWLPENVIYKTLERYRYTRLLKMMSQLNKEGLFDGNHLKLSEEGSIRSAMEKPEAEIEAGDIVLDQRGKPVKVKDKLGDDYRYDMYDVSDTRGPDTVGKEELEWLDQNPERLLPKVNPDIVASAGGTGYGDYEEKISDSSGSGLSGDVVSSHAPDVFRQEDVEEEGPPVPSEAFNLSNEKSKRLIHRESVAMRKVDALATEAVGLIRMSLYRQSQVNQYAPSAPMPLANPTQPQQVAGNPIGGPPAAASASEFRHEEHTGESEEENIDAINQSYMSQEMSQDNSHDKRLEDQNKQFQIHMMNKAERHKVALITGSSSGFESPADSNLSQIEGETTEDSSMSDDTRKVMLHEKSEDDKVEDATFPRHRDQLKPLP